jgi:hypothetical protein
MKLLVVLSFLLTTAVAQTLFLADSNNDILYTCDPSTGAATTVGSTLPRVTPCGLAHDGTTLFALDLGGVGGLYSLDTATGAPTLIGNTNLNGWQDLAWDATTSQFFAVNQNDTLYSINTVGTGTLVGSTPPVHLITAIACDNNGTLWGIDFSGAGALGTLDKNTAAFTVVHAVTISGIQGIAFHPATNALYATSTNTDSLYTIDVVTGVVTLIGPHGAGVQFAKGMTFAGNLCPVPQYQVNNTIASLTIDGVQSTSCSPAITTVASGAAVVVALSSLNVGYGFEAVISFAPLIPTFGGALITANGQILNVDLSAPGLLFLNGGASPVFQPFPGSFNLNFVAPPGPFTASIQMVVADPTHPDGFVLSQGGQLVIP